MLLDCDDPTAVHKFCSMLPPFVFEARPVISIDDAVRVELEAMAFLRRPETRLRQIGRRGIQRTDSHRVPHISAFEMWLCRMLDPPNARTRRCPRLTIPNPACAALGCLTFDSRPAARIRRSASAHPTPRILLLTVGHRRLIAPLPQLLRHRLPVRSRRHERTHRRAPQAIIVQKSLSRSASSFPR